jgi:hypothetical protein
MLIYIFSKLKRNYYTWIRIFIVDPDQATQNIADGSGSATQAKIRCTFIPSSPHLCQ